MIYRYTHKPTNLSELQVKNTCYSTMSNKKLRGAAKQTDEPVVEAAKTESKPEDKKAEEKKVKTEEEKKKDREEALEKRKKKNAEFNAKLNQFVDQGEIANIENFYTDTFGNECAKHLVENTLRHITYLQDQNCKTSHDENPFPASKFNLSMESKSKHSVEKKQPKTKSDAEPVKRKVNRKKDDDESDDEEPENTKETKQDVHQSTSEPETDEKNESSKQDEEKKDAKKAVCSVSITGKAFLQYVCDRFAYEMLSINSVKYKKANINSIESFSEYVLQNYNKKFNNLLMLVIIPTVNRLYDETQRCTTASFREKINDILLVPFKEQKLEMMVTYVAEYLFRYFNLLGKGVATYLWAWKNKPGVNANVLDQIVRTLDIGNSKYLTEHKVSNMALNSISSIQYFINVMHPTIKKETKTEADKAEPETKRGRKKKDDDKAESKQEKVTSKPNKTDKKDKKAELKQEKPAKKQKQPEVKPDDDEDDEDEDEDAEADQSDDDQDIIPSKKLVQGSD